MKRLEAHTIPWDAAGTPVSASTLNKHQYKEGNNTLDNQGNQFPSKHLHIKWIKEGIDTKSTIDICLYLIIEQVNESRGKTEGGKDQEDLVENVKGWVITVYSLQTKSYLKC